MSAGPDVDRARALMPITRRFVYMNHAAIGPLPQTAVGRAAEVARSVAETGDEHWPDRLAEAERVRGLAARLMGARAGHEVAFVANTSDGLSVAANGIDWREGDNVVGADCEFPANVYPWMRLARRGVEYRQAAERGGRVDPDELLSLVDGRTRVVALSWVQFASGFRADLRRIGAFCRERDVLFVVDGIQGLGALEVDVERDNVDVLAADGHKWLLGPEGIGVLYVSDRVVERIEPSRVGWTSVEDWIKWTRYELNYREGAGRYEPGTLNMMGVYALGASLELLLEAGPGAVEARVRSLTDRLVEGLGARGFDVVSSRREGEWSGVVAATHPARSPKEVVAGLHLKGVEVAHRAGRVRISPHFYNTHDEVDRLLAALE
jgi:cysteine desulfurase / selenocysteine lyase